MPSSKKERGRTKRYHRDINNERKAHLEQRALGPVADTELSSGQQRYYDAKFVPIVLTRALLEHDGVQMFLEAVQMGALVYWELGRKGTHISSHFLTSRGTEDTLTSPDPKDEDYCMLVNAHLHRLGELVGAAPNHATSSCQLCAF
jgi:hypothetical protein